MDHFDLVRTLKLLPGIILGLTIHEYSHALIAKWCGDNTSYDQGRVTLNPLKHIDPIGFLMLILVGFGWAKPVQFNEQNLRNPRTDVLKIAIAGPLSNAILAMILSVIFVISSHFFPGYYGTVASVTFEVLMYSIYINWALFIFNLIPLPPLDGSHLLFHPLKRYPEVYNALYKYGSFLLLGVLVISSISKSNFLPIGPAIQFFHQGFLNILGYH
jgi:Zn-dependent protease